MSLTSKTQIIDDAKVSFIIELEFGKVQTDTGNYNLYKRYERFKHYKRYKRSRVQFYPYKCAVSNFP